MSDGYTDNDAYKNAMRVAETAAIASGKSMVLGYSNYAGWCHVDAADINAVAELGDVLVIQPEDKKSEASA